MEMKKGGLILAFLFGLILVSSIVAAQNLPSPAPNLNLPAGNAAGDLGNAFKPIVDIFAGLFSGLATSLDTLTGGTGIGQFVFAKFIIFLILAFILAKPAQKITGDSENIGWTVSILVSMLGVYFLPESVIRLIIVPYNALAVTIMLTSVIILGFLFFEKYTRSIRRIGWMLLSISIAGLYLYNAATYTGLDDGIKVAYAVGFLGSLALFFFDKTMNNFFTKMKLEKEEQTRAYERLNTLQTEYNKLGDAYTEALKNSNQQAATAILARQDSIRKSMILASRQVSRA